MPTQIQKEREKIIKNIKHCKWHVIKVYGSVVAVKFLAYEYLKEFNINNKGLKYSEWFPLSIRVLSGSLRPTIETVCCWGHYGRPESSRYLGAFDTLLDNPVEMYKPQEQQKQYIKNNSFGSFIQF